MKTLGVLFLSLAVISCGGSSDKLSSAAGDPAVVEDDVEDTDAKTDSASYPLGLYEIVEPEHGFEEGTARITLLDLHKDMTCYYEDAGMVAYDESNYGEGVGYNRCIYSFTKSSTGKKYIRFYAQPIGDEKKKQLDKWEYKMSSGALKFLWNTGETYSMKADKTITKTFREATKKAFGEANLTDLKEVAHASAPAAARESYGYFEKVYGPDYLPIIVKLKVDSTWTYVVNVDTDGGSLFEIFAESGQMVAGGGIGESASDISWDDL